MKRYLKSGQIDVDCKGRGNWTALALASFFGKHDFVDLLLQYKADVNVRFGSDLQTCLHIACYFDDCGLISLLSKTGYLDLNLRDGKDRSALDYCVYYGSTNCFELLMDMEAETSSLTLFYALKRKRTFEVGILCSYGNAMEQTYDTYIADQGEFVRGRRRAILVAAQNGFDEALVKIVVNLDIAFEEFDGIFIRPAHGIL